MSAAVYSRLLDEFRALWVEIGNTSMVLEFAANDYSADLSFGRKGSVYEIVGGACLPFPESDDGRFAFAIIRRVPKNESQITEFQRLCAEAGAHLPAVIRDVVGDYYWSVYTHPAGWWTALMARRFQIPATNIDKGYLVRPKIINPLEASIDLIEVLRLNTDWPAWPETNLTEIGTPDPGVKASGMSWEEAAKRLEALRLQGEKYTSQSKIAKEIGCSVGLVNKAIHSKPSLQVWARVDPTPKAQSINEVVTDSTAQNREPNPEDAAAIREYIERDDITADEKAVFLAKSQADQVAYLNALADALADDPDANPNAVDPVTKGIGRLHERILGRKP